MDCRSVLLFCLAVFLAVLAIQTEGRTKKVIIHVPYKVKKIKHTHTVYKRVHHHHSHHDHLNHLDHLEHLENILPPAEEHEHFHHMHLLDEAPIPARSQPIQSAAIPEFLPDEPMDLSLDLSDLSRDIPGIRIPKRHGIPLYRRNDKELTGLVTSDRPEKENTVLDD